MLGIKKKRVIIYYMYVDRAPGDGIRVATKMISEAGGRLLEYAVSRLYRIGSGELERKKGENGKPYFCGHPEIHFNISHSGDLVMCAVSDYEIGVDVQEKKARCLGKLAKRILTPDEHAEYLTSDNAEELFFRLWVMKEAYLKWTGEGITRELRGLKTYGWHQFVHVDSDYASCVWADRPLDVVTVQIHGELGEDPSCARAVWPAPKKTEAAYIPESSLLYRPGRTQHRHTAKTD